MLPELLAALLDPASAAQALDGESDASGDPADGGLDASGDPEDVLGDGDPALVETSSDCCSMTTASPPPNASWTAIINSLPYLVLFSLANVCLTWLLDMSYE